MQKVKRPIKVLTNREIDDHSSTDWEWENDSEHSIPLVPIDTETTPSYDEDKMW